MSNIPPLDSDPVNANMQPAHGTLVQDGRSLDDQEYQRGDPVAIVENGTEEDLTDAIYILNFRTKQRMLVPLKAVCWLPTHTEQRFGNTFLLTLYGHSLDFRRHASERPQMGYRGIAMLFGSCVHVGREAMLKGNASRVNLEPANRASLFTAQWDSLSLSEDAQQPALTVRERRDSAIEIQDPESPISKSSTGLMSASPKPFHIPTTSFATKPNTRIVAQAPKARPHGSNTWSNLETDDEYPAFADNLPHGIGEHYMNGMMVDADLQVNFAFMPQNESSNYVPEQHDQQRPDTNAQEPLWVTQGLDTDNGNAWDTFQMPPQHAPEMRQPQLPMPQRQQALPSRIANHTDYCEQDHLAEEQDSSHNQNEPVGHHPQQPESIYMQHDPGAGYLSPQIPPSNRSQPHQDFQMHSRYPEQSNRLPTPGPSFPAPQEVHVIQSNRPTSRPSYPLPSRSRSPVEEGGLPSTSQNPQLRHSYSRPSNTRGTPVMARRAPAQTVHTFTPSGIIDSFRQSTQAHISSLESHCEQLQQSQTSDDQLRQASESLQAARRNNEESLQLLGLLQPITGIPLKGTEKRLQSIADQIIDAIKSLLPDCSDGSDKTIEQLGQKVQSLKEFIEYVEGVHPEVVKRPQDPATESMDKSQAAPVTTANPAPSALLSVSSHTADESDSCRRVDGTHSVPAEPPHAAGQGFFQRPLPTQVPQTVPIADHGAPMRDQTMQAYPPPTSVGMMRPMQPMSSLPPLYHTTQQESNFYLRTPPQDCLYPTTGAEMAQAAYAPQSSADYPTAPAPAQSNHYQEIRPGLPGRRAVQQKRPAPYSLNYRDQRRPRGSQ
ncbi:hypothetical protein CLIM01_14121 [Colletotrichum limetticola]|uniref:Uncharacterized protein n=1 Tax=Colletotrichum limetticola TaxID=1209924 RepID=A0ABQ9PDL8_9PEZI|nr:hypothetical protein CLIM01_14121 [Colletotrichum limetticola]